jgi:hypothetical protein
MLTELIMVNTQDNKSSWLLRGSILAAVEHLLNQLNLDDRARARQQWKDAQRSRPLSQLPPIFSAALPHPERPALRGLPPGATWRHAFARQPEEPEPTDQREDGDG